MKLYIPTLTWNGQSCLDNLYPSLMKALVGFNYNWLIRDNASEDSTNELVSSWNNANVTYYKAPDNKSNYSQGNNQLILDSSIDYDNDYILFLNNDITIEDDQSIRYMVDILDNDSEVGIVGARLFYPGGKLIQHAGVAFSQAHGEMPWHIFSRGEDSAFTNQNRTFQAVTGAFLLMRGSCFKNLTFGKMDERLYWAFDDIAMCLDVCYNQKKKIVYCGKTNITHHESVSLKKNNVNERFMNHNVAMFKSLWRKSYTLDYNQYLIDSNYSLYSCHKK